MAEKEEVDSLDERLYVCDSCGWGVDRNHDLRRHGASIHLRPNTAECWVCNMHCKQQPHPMKHGVKAHLWSSTKLVQRL